VAEGMVPARRRRRVPPAIPVAIAVAWLLAVAAQATGRASELHHNALIHSRLPLWAQLAVFLVAWQAMIAAMMLPSTLPSTLPILRLLGQVSAGRQRHRVTVGAFLGGYAGVWTGFGALAFLGDVALHRTVHRTPWLAAHPWVIAGSTLAAAGLFQFSVLKDVCLARYRAPGAYLPSRYRRGVRGALRLGWEHGLFCLGCCWALMLLMFAAGVANLWWMAALTALMVYETVSRNGTRAVPVAGMALLALAALALLHPVWAQSLLGSA
jgi:predicted metal-binding membrane protein